MRRFVHWLKINRYASDEAKQFDEIQKYLDNYTDARATIFSYDSGSFNIIVKLVCHQSYKDLDLNVNTMSNNLERLNGKPRGISEIGRFRIPDYLLS